jgi:hypothetical protein
LLKEFKLNFKSYDNFRKFKFLLINTFKNKRLLFDSLSLEHIVYKQKDLILDDISGELEVVFQSTLNKNDIYSCFKEYN